MLEGGDDIGCRLFEGEMMAYEMMEDGHDGMMVGGDDGGWR